MLWSSLLTYFIVHASIALITYQDLSNHVSCLHFGSYCTLYFCGFVWGVSNWDTLLKYQAWKPADWNPKSSWEQCLGSCMASYWISSLQVAIKLICCYGLLSILLKLVIWLAMLLNKIKCFRCWFPPLISAVVAMTTVPSFGAEIDPEIIPEMLLRRTKVFFLAIIIWYFLVGIAMERVW